MYAWTLQIKVPADPVWYHARNCASGDSCSLCIVRVHSRHPHIIFQHRGRKDCGARSSKAVDWDARCSKGTVSISFTAVRGNAGDSFPTFLESSVRRLECPSLHWVHSFGLFRGHRKERSVERSDIFINEMPSATIELSK